MFKLTLGAILVVGVIYVLLDARYNQDVVVENQVSTEVETVVETDEIERAKQELERISAELDAKEQSLLEERAKIDAELERVRETRVGFQ